MTVSRIDYTPVGSMYLYFPCPSELFIAVTQTLILLSIDYRDIT